MLRGRAGEPLSLGSDVTRCGGAPALLSASVAPWRCRRVVGSLPSCVWWTRSGEARSRAAASRRFPAAGQEGAGLTRPRTETRAGRAKVSSEGGRAGGPGVGSGLQPFGRGWTPTLREGLSRGPGCPERRREKATDSESLPNEQGPLALVSPGFP